MNTNTNPVFELKFELVPKFKKDKQTGYYMAYFESFPNASSSGETMDEAKNGLFEVFSIMLTERKDEILKKLLDVYYEGSPLKGSQKIKELEVACA